MTFLLQPTTTVTLLGTCVLALQAGAGLAQSLPVSAGGFHVDGHVELSHFDDSGSDTSFLNADLEFGVMPGSEFSGGPWGFQLDIESLTDFDFHNDAYYLSVLYGTGSHLFSLGAPRSVVDRGYIPERNFANNTFLSYQLTQYTGSYFAALLLSTDETAYGARWDGTFGNTRIGASYHQVDGSDVKVYSLAGAHEFGAISSFADFVGFFGLEHLDAGGGTTFRSVHIGGEAQTERLTSGLIFHQLDTGASANITELYLNYDILENIELEASLMQFDTPGTNDTVWGLGAKYQFANGFYGDLSYVDFAPANDQYWELSVGYEF